MVDSLGNSYHMFTARQHVEQFASGSTLSFRVSANDKGALAEDVTVAEEEAA